MIGRGGGGEGRARKQELGEWRPLVVFFCLPPPLALYRRNFIRWRCVCLRTPPWSLLPASSWKETRAEGEKERGATKAAFALALPAFSLPPFRLSPLTPVSMLAARVAASDLVVSHCPCAWGALLLFFVLPAFPKLSTPWRPALRRTPHVILPDPHPPSPTSHPTSPPLLQQHRGPASRSQTPPLLAHRLAGGSVAPNLSMPIASSSSDTTASSRASASQQPYPGVSHHQVLSLQPPGGSLGRPEDDVMQIFQANFGADPFGGSLVGSGINPPLSIQSLQGSIGTPQQHRQHGQQQHQHHHQHHHHQQQQQQAHQQQMQLLNNMSSVNSMLGMGNHAGLAAGSGGGDFMPATLDSSALYDAGFWSHPVSHASTLLAPQVAPPTGAAAAAAASSTTTASNGASAAASASAAPPSWSGASAVTMPVPSSSFYNTAAAAAAPSFATSSTQMSGSSSSMAPSSLSGSQAQAGLAAGGQQEGVAMQNQVAALASSTSGSIGNDKTEAAIRMMDTSLAGAVYKLATQGRLSILDALALTAHVYMLDQNDASLSPLENMLLHWAQKILTTPPMPPNSIYPAARQVCAQLGITLESQAR